MPPIIEEDEIDYQFGYKQTVPQNTLSNGVGSQVKPLVVEELPSAPENEEKAIVLFNPVNKPLVYSEGKFSVDPNLISCFRSKLLLVTLPSFSCLCITLTKPFFVVHLLPWKLEILMRRFCWPSLSVIVHLFFFSCYYDSLSLDGSR